MAELSDQEMMRYNRQIILRGFDFDGQERLKEAKVLVVGLGGLGCAATQYLAAAGIGQLSLVDFDTVALSNLQRQTLHSDATIGLPKVDSARDALARINPHTHLVTHNAMLDDDALWALIAQHDLVLDCTDNVAVRNQLNAGCFRHKTPLVSGAAIRMEGQISVFTWQDGEPCYRCLSRLFGENALTCVEAGVMSPLIAEPAGLLLEDALRFTADNHFHLLGRRGRVVKIAEKRVSLAEVEQRVLSLEGVRDAAAILLTHGTRQNVGVLLVLTDDARQAWQRASRKREQAWRQALRPWLEPVALPRFWRVVDVIPVNTMNKRIDAQLQEYFHDHDAR